MKTIEFGHIYDLDQLDSTEVQRLTFVSREGKRYPGVTNQEVLKALIARVQYLNRQLHADENIHIIHHLRMALVYHESRALRRKVEKGDLHPEIVTFDTDMHFKLES